MVKEKTGFSIAIPGTSLTVRGDEYMCPGCKRIVFGDFGEPFQRLPEIMAEAYHEVPERYENDLGELGRQEAQQDADADRRDNE